MPSEKALFFEKNTYFDFIRFYANIMNARKHKNVVAQWGRYTKIMLEINIL